MNIYTSYFANVRKLPPNVIPVSIALYQPKRWAGQSLSTLAPTQEILGKYKIDHDEAAYKAAYNQILDRLNPAALRDSLESLFRGKDIVLICYERPDTFCHRHIVAEWLKANGIECEEWDSGGGGVNETGSANDNRRELHD